MEIKDIAKEVEDKIGIINAQNAVTMIMTSIGCHFLNLQQKRVTDDVEPFLFRFGQPVDLRKHLMFVRIPGTGKSTILRFLHDILPNTLKEAGQVQYLNTITEAGFSGTIRETRNGIKEIPGVAQKCDKGFVIVEEFSSILESFNAGHSSTFEQTLLLALDSGKVIKSLASGTIEYETNLTFCCGIQPIKMMSTSSGMLRRFLVEFYIPDSQSLREIKLKSRESWNKDFNYKAIEEIQEIQEFIANNIYQVKDYVIEDRVFEFFDEFDVPVAIESDIYMQALFGYNFMNGNVEDGTLIVDVDDTVKRMIEVDYHSRRLISFDMQSLIVLMIINELIEEGTVLPSNIAVSDIFLKAVIYQISFEEIIKAVERLCRIGILQRTANLDCYRLIHKEFMDTIINSVKKVQGLIE